MLLNPSLITHIFSSFPIKEAASCQFAFQLSFITGVTMVLLSDITYALISNAPYFSSTMTYIVYVDWPGN
jgi:hypothetical protein